LLAAGAAIDVADADGCTALMYAVRFQKAKAVEVLLAAGATVNAEWDGN
jgi:ankyrin repeat protein